ncbi:small s protein [Fusarium fujikuroi]|nr:small s protein [Fusarium fujikuroi]
MDPLSSVGLASNILQFVEFSVKLVSKGVEIYSSTDGAPLQHADLRASLDNLRELAAPFRQRKNLRLSRDPDEIRIVQTAIACNEIAHDLEDALDGLVATPHSMTSSVLKALQSVWEQGKIDYMVGRLEGYRSDLQLMMINAVLNRQSFLQRSIDTLKSNNDELGIKSDVMIARVQDLKDELRDILHASQHSMPWVDAAFLPHFADNALRDKLGELYAEAQEIAKATDMLRSLRFHRMTLRRHNVADRHLTTLEWAYEKHHEGQRLHFREWLEVARGYTGLLYLRSWAGQQQNLVMADFFFWKPGAELERSQSGLLRSLLYEVLRQMPAIMPRVLGARWDDWITDQPWTLSELQEIFRLVSEKSRTSNHPDIKFCFFVDGLDEYMGQSHEIAQAVQELSDTPNIKLCVSSRPWNTFEAVFGHDEKALLRVHEHNREDIRRYVHEILGQHRSFKQLVLENQEYQRVLHKIVSKAKGVFL